MRRALASLDMLTLLLGAKGGGSCYGDADPVAGDFAESSQVFN